MLASDAKPHLIVTVHGIRTFGKWQERLEQLVRVGDDGDDADVEFCHFKLGYFSLFAFLVPPLRWLVVRQFRNELRRLVANAKRSRVDIVGHSFGTHVIGWALWGLRLDETVSVHTVILSGSVLRSGFNWSRLIGTRVFRVINDCGARDSVLLLSQFFVLFTGMAGRTGFSGMTSRNFRNRISLFGHSGYFQDGNHKPDDRYMQDNWVELLVKENPIRHFNDLPEGGALNGLLIWMSNNAEPVKLTFYLAPLVAIILWVWGQRQEAVRQKEVAQINESMAIASENRATRNEVRAVRSEQVAKENLAAMQENQSRFIASAANDMLPTDPERSLGLTLQVIPGNVTQPDRPIVPEALAVAYKAANLNQLRAVLDSRSANLHSAEFNKDGSLIVTSSTDGTARIWDAKIGVELAVLRGHTDSVRSAVFSPDGKRVATVSRDKTARIWDVATGSELSTLIGHTGWVNKGAFSGDGTRLVTGSSDHTARVWNCQTGTLVAVLLGYNDDIDDVTFSLDGKLVLGSGSFNFNPQDKTARIWDAETGVTKTILKGHTEGITHIAFSPSGKFAITGSIDMTARIWDVYTGKPIVVLTGHTDSITAARFSNDGSRVLTASEDTTARIWDAKTGAEIRQFRGHSSAVNDAKFSPSQSNVITASRDKTVRIWDAKTGVKLSELHGHAAEVMSAAYNADETRIVSASMDSTTRIWSAPNKPDMLTLVGDGSEIQSLMFSRDGRHLISTSKGQVPVIWDTASGRQVGTLRGHTDSVYAAAFSADGKLVVTASADDTARIWDANKIGVQKGELRIRDSIIWDASFGDNDTKIVTASSDNAARVWGAANYKLLQTFIHDDGVLSAAFNSNGTRILTVTLEDIASLWSMETGGLVARWGSQSDRISAAVFSDDGKNVVTATQKGSIRLWNAESGEAIRALGDLGGWASEVSFSPNGKVVVVALGDHTVRVLDVNTGKGLLALRGHENNVRRSKFTPDGRRIVTASGGDLRVWDSATGTQIDQIGEGKILIKKVAMSPDGRQVAVAFEDNRVQLKTIPTFSSDVWLPALRARMFSPVSLEDKIRFGLDTAGEDRRTSDAVSLCDSLTGYPFDPARAKYGVPRIADASAAIEACERAKDVSNEPRIYYGLGRALAANRQYKAAEDAYAIAANSDYGMAFYGLALLYEGKRRDFVQDLKKATEHYGRAMELGVAIAGYPLGRMFWEGNGIAPDRTKARLIWEGAAAAGDPFSHQQLAMLAENTLGGGRQDLEFALYHYLVAARLLETKREDSNHAHLRGATIAHALPIEAVARIWQSAQDWKPL